MANLNKVMLMGNLTADPELRATPKGLAVTDIRLAINRYLGGEGGERREEVVYLDVTLWGKQAEFACQYMSKGHGVFVEGRLQMDSWEDKQTGQKRSRLRVIGESIQAISSRSGGQGGGGARPTGNPPSRAERSNMSASSEPAGMDEGFDDDIPF